MSQSSEPVKRAKAVSRALEGFVETSRLLAGRASTLELHAVKNSLANRDKGAVRKQAQAEHFRHIATFLATAELREAILANERLMSFLMAEVPMHAPYDHLKPRPINLDSVKPSKTRAQRQYEASEHFDYEE